MISEEYYGLEASYKIITPRKARKKFDVQTNTDAQTYACKSCCAKEQKTLELESKIDTQEYLKSINYINSVHKLFNECVLKRDSSGTQFELPNIPNFLSVFISFGKPQVKSEATSTSSLESLCAIISHHESKKICSSKDKVSLPPESDHGDCQSRATSKSKFARQTTFKKPSDIFQIVQNASAKVDTRWKDCRYINSTSSNLAVKRELNLSKKASSKSDGSESPNVHSANLSEAEIDKFALQLVPTLTSNCDSCDNETSSGSTPKNHKLKFFPTSTCLPGSREAVRKKSVCMAFPKLRVKPSTASTPTRPKIPSNRCTLKSCNSEQQYNSSKNNFKHEIKSHFRVPSLTTVKKSKSRRAAIIIKQDEEKLPQMNKQAKLHYAPITHVNILSTEIPSIDAKELLEPPEEYFFAPPHDSESNNTIVASPASSKSQVSNLESEIINLNYCIAKCEQRLESSGTGSNQSLNSSKSSDVKSDREVSRIPISSTSNLYSKN